LLLPLTLNTLFHSLSRKLHPLLVSPSTILVPLNNSDIHINKSSSPQQQQLLPSKRFPLSSCILALVRQSLSDFYQLRTDDGMTITELNEGKRCFLTIIEELGKLLIEKIRKVQIELEDVVLYKDKPIREWLINKGFYKDNHIPGNK
jgi:hypothetical protein